MRSRGFIIAMLLLPGLFCFGQKKQNDPVAHDKEVRSMIAFLEYMLNTLGDAETANRDKDVLVMESYAKIFRDAKVQIEDDLDENRKVITNKDVQAYLKDVDFFFKDVQFEFDIENIETRGSGAERIVYRVALRRNLTGTTLDGKKVNNTQPRFVEINYDNSSQDLKIASIYTNEFNEKEALTAWWNSLSYEWQSIFRNQLNISDSVSLYDIREMTSIDTLDLSGNQFIQKIEPLSQLLDLRRLSIAHTEVVDLSPLRNLTNLVNLNIAHTKTTDLSALRYCLSLERLNLSHTDVDSVNVLSRLVNLNSLDLSGTDIADFSPLADIHKLKTLNLSRTPIHSVDMIDSLSNLQTLDISHTKVDTLSALASLKKLEVLNLDSLPIQSIDALSSLTSLRILQMNHTRLRKLEPLLNLNKLQRVYCDNTRIDQKIADAFTSQRPNVLIIFDSEDLRGWWSDIPNVWKDVLSRAARISMKPTKEELARITNLDSINLSNYTTIKNLQPLTRLLKLQVVIAHHTGIRNLEPLRNLDQLRTVDISNTEVNDITVLAKHQNLQSLLADETQVSRIDTLGEVKSLKRIYADGSRVNDEEVKQLIRQNPGVLVVYKTTELEEWWNGLTDAWRLALQEQINVNTKPTRQNFHRLILVEAIRIKNIPVNDLSALHPFLRLKELTLQGTSVTTLGPLAELPTLELVHINGSAVRELDALAYLEALRDVDISNTPVDDLEPLRNCGNLSKLNCAGTNVKKLAPLRDLANLAFLDCSNTPVRSLRDVEELGLRHLRCFNTKISSGKISDFQEKNPDCEIVYYR